MHAFVLDKRKVVVDGFTEEKFFRWKLKSPNCAQRLHGA